MLGAPPSIPAQCDHDPMTLPAKHAVIGMSHIQSLRHGWEEMAGTHPGSEFDFLNLRDLRRAGNAAGDTDSERCEMYTEREKIQMTVADMVSGKDVLILCISGNEHNVIGLCEAHGFSDAKRIVQRRSRRILEQWLELLRSVTAIPGVLLVPPPPIESEAHIRTYPGPFRKLLQQHPLRAAKDRLKLWQAQRDIIVQLGQSHAIAVLHPPAETLSARGFLAPQYQGRDPTHGNAAYGRHVIASVIATRNAAGAEPVAAAVHPYAELPESAYWQQSVSDVQPQDVDPVVAPRFLIDAKDAVATAGSCFAQHISRRLRSQGFNLMTMEEPPEPSSDSTQSPGYDFSARCGNIYTSRQLLQLFDRAFGFFEPFERAWSRSDGRFCDPFRPRIEPHGFDSEQSVEQDMTRHLDAVQRMFRELDVFVFTLGLTECWISRADGAAYPVAPGVVGGRYDPSKHQFINLSEAEIRHDLDQFIARLKAVNPSARILLTVSPVPLMATYEPRHVLVSTTYSKAALRVAAEEIIALHRHVEYFPSFEIITGAHAEGGYFGTDRRSVTDSGVDHVMRIFMSRMTTAPDSAQPTSQNIPVAAGLQAELDAAAEAACDEEMYRRNQPEH